MTKINLNRKRFIPIANSKNGEVTTQTIFDYTEYDGIVRATYQGGTILSGHILGQWISEHQLKMSYHCLTTAQKLRIGQATATIRQNKSGWIEMDLEWQWLGSDSGNGTSKYKEIKK